MAEDTGRSFKVFKRNGQFVHQFIEKFKAEDASYATETVVWECTSYLIENQEVTLDWLANGKHPKWTYR